MEHAFKKDFIVGMSSYQKAVIKSPEYPIPDTLRVKLKNPKERMIDVYVGSGPYRELVIRIPPAVLEYFSPKHRASLSADKKKASLELPNCCKHAVKWIMSWMVLGGVEKNNKDTSLITMSPIDRLLNRLQVITEFQIGGELYSALYYEFAIQVVSGVIPADRLIEIFSADAPVPIKAMCKDLAWSIVENVLDGTITSPVAGVTSNTLLMEDVKAFLGTKTHRFHAMQRIHRMRPSIFQLKFLYTFTNVGSALREKVVRDLLDLMDAGKVPNGKDYKLFAVETPAFGEDLKKATDEKAAKAIANHKEKVAKAQAHVERLKSEQQNRHWPSLSDSSTQSITPNGHVHSNAIAHISHIDVTTAKAVPAVPSRRKTKGVPNQKLKSETANLGAENPAMTNSTPKPKRKAKRNAIPPQAATQKAQRLNGPEL